MGRKPNTKQYALYQVIDGADVYVGQFIKDVIRDEYGINTRSLKSDMEKGITFRGRFGRYKIKEAKTMEEHINEARRTNMQHVTAIHCASGCRFGG